MAGVEASRQARGALLQGQIRHSGPERPLGTAARLEPVESEFAFSLDLARAAASRSPSQQNAEKWILKSAKIGERKEFFPQKIEYEARFGP